MANTRPMLTITVLGLAIAAAVGGCGGAITPAFAPSTPTLNPTADDPPDEPPARAVAQQATPTPAPTAAPTATPADTRTDVVIWWPAAIAPGADTPGAEILAEQIDAFQEAYNHTVTLRVKRVDGAGGILSTLGTAGSVAPRALPDVVLLPYTTLRSAAAAALIFPLDEQIPTAITGSLYPPALNLGQTNDALYGIAYGLTLHHAAYHPSRYETAPESTADLLAAEERFAFALNDESGPSPAVIIQYTAAGGRFTDDEGRPLLDEGPLLDVLTFYEQAVANRLLDAAAFEAGAPADYWPDFLDGQIGLIQIDSSAFLAAQSQAVDIAAAPLPVPTSGAYTLLDGWLWAITTADPARQAAAMDFLTWMLGATNQAALTQAEGLLPSQPLALQMWEATDYTQMIATLLGDEDGAILPSAVDTTAGDALQAAVDSVINGEATAADAAAAALATLE